MHGVSIEAYKPDNFTDCPAIFRLIQVRDLDTGHCQATVIIFT